MIKDYLRTFKPIDFSSRGRLIGGVLFTLSVSVLIFLCYEVMGFKYPYPIFTNYFYLTIFSLSLGVLFFLSVDNTGGFGRNYLEKIGWRNFLVIFPLWIVYFIFNYFLFFNY
jgi:hypothetical protein